MLFMYNPRIKFYCTVLFLLFSFIVEAKVSVKGKVIDKADGSGIPGVSIRIKGSSSGAVSDVQGNFQLTVEDNAILLFSAVGYLNQEVAVNGKSQINVSLIQSNRELDQVVVVGYGQARKVDITGATQSLKAEDLIKQPVMTATQAIQGKAAGVQIINNGKPGTSPTIRIRGVGTALAGTSTLFVVDGVLTDDITNISMSDITNIDILKDASSTAIYGSRGANGVIIITTKKGKSGIQVNYSGMSGLRQASNLVEMANSAEYNNYISAIGVQVPPAESISTDWYSKILRTAFMQNHNLSISGGNEKISNYLSLSYLADEGIVIKNHFERLTARFNQEYRWNEKFSFGFNASYNNSTDQNVNLGSAYNNAYRAAPIIEGFRDGRYGNTSLFQNVGNPILDINNNDDQVKSHRLQASAFINYKILEYLTFRSNLGGDYVNNSGRTYNNKFANDNTFFLDAGGNQRNPNSNLSVFQASSFRTVWDNTLTFNKKWEEHNLTVLVGTTSEEFKSNRFGAFRRDVPASQNLWYLNTGNANTSTNYGDGDMWRRQAYISRMNYNFNDKYLLTATMRADGSSNFAKANRWGYFPSLGLGWVISNEPFMADLPLFETLKLRTSWGLVGNDRIPSDAYIVTVEPNLAYPFGGGVATLGSAITQIKDPNLKWETTEEIDFGIEFSMFKGKLQGEFGYYNKIAKDLLINVKVPSVVGDKDGVVLTNAASIQNSGIEGMLNYRNTLSKDISIRVGANATLNKNSVIGLNGGQPILDGGIGAAQFYTTRTDNGQPVGSFYVLNVLGVFQNDAEIADYKDKGGNVIQPSAAPGSFKYEDVNRDGKIDDSDRVFAGSYQPAAYFGFNVGLSYKNFDFSVDAIGNVGNKIYNGKRAFRQGALDNVEKSMAYGRWSRGSGIQTEPAANAGFLPASTYFIESGDFIRLNNISLTYNLPSTLLSKMKVANARVFISGQNLFTLKKFSGFTPELSSDSPTAAGIELNAYPITKTLTIGLNVGF
jgi:TonB-linked SusC/RagA family outer membrane protein